MLPMVKIGKHFTAEIVLNGKYSLSHYLYVDKRPWSCRLCKKCAFSNDN